jgi:hypothetical protein
MPRGDGTGPDGKGPKRKNKGIPSRDGRGSGMRRNRNPEGSGRKRRDKT